jgi:hypothetical protein
MPEVYYYDFYRVPKSSLITEILKYIYKKPQFHMCYESMTRLARLERLRISGVRRFVS